MELFNQAEKKLQGGFMTMFTGLPYDEACELFEQAGNRLKLEKNFEKASEAFLRCAFCVEKAHGARFQMANYYLESGHCLKRIGVKSALSTYEKMLLK